MSDTTSIVRHSPGTTIVQPAYTPDQVALIKNTIAKGTTDDELSLFVMTCKRTGLDPFAKQIYAIKRKSKDRDGNWVETMTIQTAIDGYRLVGHRTGELEGIDGPYWCGEDGVWREIWLDAKKPPAGAKTIVYRLGVRVPFVGAISWHEFNQGNAQWNSRGAHMLGKCSEALALRKAFPAELSGTHVREEIADDEPEVFVRPEPPAPAKEAPRRAPKPKEPPPTQTVDKTGLVTPAPPPATSHGPIVGVVATGPAPAAVADYEASAERVARVAEVIDAVADPIVNVVAAEDDDFGEVPPEPEPEPAIGMPPEMLAFRRDIQAATTEEAMRVAKAKHIPWSNTPAGKAWADVMKNEWLERLARVKGGR